MAHEDTEVMIEQMEEADFASAFDCISRCFGEQVQDGVWTAMNPGWDTPKGKADGTARMVQRWQSTTRDKQGNPNTIFLKATALDPHNPSRHVIAGVAIWAQLSMIKDLGDEPSTDVSTAMDLADLLPGNETEQRFLRQCFASFVSQRVEFLRAKAKTDSPSTFSLDLCVVDPSFQRRGIAVKLVQWGLEEARARGNLESTTEGSGMGRHVYAKIGFRPVKEVEYHVDDEFKHRKLPANVFMRTGTTSMTP